MRVMNSTHSASPHAARSEKLARRWLELCTLYLPVAPEGSLWRYSRPQRADEPEQGWKLHVSATVLNAPRVLARVGPLLKGLGISFKAPTSLQEVQRLNSGIYYAYSQVGKIITVYPRRDEEAIVLARRLHELTRRMSAPAVPFDLSYRSGSNVYYRYGAFKSYELELPSGGRVPALLDPVGQAVPDLRTNAEAKPAWVSDPFTRKTPRLAAPEPDGPLGTTYRILRALAQRGKGGVYQALDLSVQPPRLCLLKEGRKWGEVGWDGRDGHWRVRHEERVLTRLRASGIDVPRVYSSFESGGNYYFVTEFIDGESLQAFLFKRQRRLSVARVLRHGIQLAGFMAQIHAAGWVWRDCKPANLIITSRGELRPLDFEGACPVGRSDSLPWMTPAFTLPGAHGQARAGEYDDLYALGAVIYLLLAGRMPEALPAPAPVRRLRQDTPPEVCTLVTGLLNPGERRMPDARAVARRLRAALDRTRPLGSTVAVGAQTLMKAAGAV
jgi:hypothetical protein